MLYFSLTAIAILLVLSALFSASETGVIAVSKARLYSLGKKGDMRARVITTLRQDMGRLVSTLLIGGTLINITASTLATGVLIRFFGDAGVAYATFLMGGLIIFYGEVLPKIYAINNPEETVTRVAFPLSWIVKILSPLSRLIDRLARKTLMMLGVKTGSAYQTTTNAEELRGLIDLLTDQGEWDAHEQSMLRSILDLATVDVSEIMTHRKEVMMLDNGASPESIVQEVLESPYTRLPIWRNNPDNIVGVLHAKALFREVHQKKEPNILEIASKPWFIPESTTLLDQLQAFREKREHFAVVVDEYGAFMGVVTLEDILEEIVGEIVDEHDVEIPGVRIASDGTVVVVGSVTIRDLNRQFDWDLPDEEAATIAGLVLHETRKIPEVGNSFSLHGFLFTVLRRHRNQLTLLRIASNKREDNLNNPPDV